jgi:hypothetical protein
MKFSERLEYPHPGYHNSHDLNQPTLPEPVLHEALWQTNGNDKQLVVDVPVTQPLLAMLSPDHKGNSAPELVVKHARQFLEGEIR